MAGILCGHFQVPFVVFFSATFIGKAVNKVSLQVFCIIIAFSKHLMSRYLDMLSSFSPRVAAFISDALDKQK